MRQWLISIAIFLGVWVLIFYIIWPAISGVLFLFFVVVAVAAVIDYAYNPKHRN